MFPVAAKTRARATPLSAISDPGDRSMLREIIAKVVPTATIASAAFCSSRLRTLATVRNPGLAIVKIATSTPNISSRP